MVRSYDGFGPLDQHLRVLPPAKADKRRSLFQTAPSSQFQPPDRQRLGRDIHFNW